jgi:8-oxo-dGTP diphosphatase
MENQKQELHRIACTAIIHKAGRYLILKRSSDKKTFPGKWTVAGGGLEMADYVNTPKVTPDAWYFVLNNSLRREIKEETGLEVGKMHYLLDLAFLRPDGLPVLTLSYWCDWVSGEVKLNKENTAYQWVSCEEARNYDLIGGILEEIEMVDKILKGEDPREVETKLKR